MGRSPLPLGRSPARFSITASQKSASMSCMHFSTLCLAYHSILPFLCPVVRSALLSALSRSRSRLSPCPTVRCVLYCLINCPLHCPELFCPALPLPMSCPALPCRDPAPARPALPLPLPLLLSCPCPCPVPATATATAPTLPYHTLPCPALPCFESAALNLLPLPLSLPCPALR